MKSKLLWGVLALSVALNIFIVGILLGRVNSVKEKVQANTGPRYELNIRQLGPLFPRKLRREARQEFFAKTDELRATFKERRQLEREIRSLVGAENLDMIAIKEALTRWQMLSDTLRETPQDIMLKVLPKAPYEVRQEIADKLFRPRNERFGPPPRPGGLNGPPRGGRFRDGPPPEDGDFPPGGPPEGPPPEGPPPEGPPD